MSQSTFNDEVSIEKGDMARGDDGGSAFIGLIPRLSARAAQEVVGGSGAAGAASFSAISLYNLKNDRFAKEDGRNDYLPRAD